jgi:hypothetical protein
MENIMKQIIKQIKNIFFFDANVSLSIKYYSDNDIKYDINLVFLPTYLSDLPTQKIDDNDDFEYDNSEFGGLVSYNNIGYIRRINLNLYNNETDNEKNCLQFFYLSKKRESEYKFEYEYEEGIDYEGPITEYFLIEDVHQKIINKLANIFDDFWVNYEIKLDQKFFTFKIIIYKYKDEWVRMLV